jgi:hypothetical protein
MAEIYLFDPLKTQKFNPCCATQPNLAVITGISSLTMTLRHLEKELKQVVCSLVRKSIKNDR